MTSFVEVERALVTGGGTGIGRAAALALAAQGCFVTVAGRTERTLQQTVDLVEKAGGSAQLVICDVTDEAMDQAAIRTATGDERHLDVAVNSAGYDGEVAAPTAEWTVDMLDEMLSSNVRGTFLSMKYELTQMKSQGFGAIVNVGSDAGLLGVPGHSGYVASKHAGIGLTRSAALEYAAEGIRVNAVCPALVDTPLIHDSDGNLFDYINPLIAAHPLGRIAQAAEIADAIVWLCSDKSSYVTGVALPVDGGYSAQ